MSKSGTLSVFEIPKFGTYDYYGGNTNEDTIMLNIFDGTNFYFTYLWYNACTSGSGNYLYGFDISNMEAGETLLPISGYTTVTIQTSSGAPGIYYRMVSQ